jgi:drug/metabolite transporter (DMT)-like permease
LTGTKDVTSQKYLVYVLLLITVIIWGGTFAAGKEAALGAPPLTVALWRFILASLILCPQLAFTEGLGLKKIDLYTFVLLLLSAATGLILYNYFFIKGLALTGAGRGSVIVTINPAFIYLGSVIFFSEKLTLIRGVGILLAICGTLVVVTGGRISAILDGGFNIGDLILTLCIVSWTAYSLLGKLVLGRISPLAANTFTSLLAVIMLIPLCLLAQEPLDAFLGFTYDTWLSIGFLGLLGTALGFTFFYRGILILGPHKAGVFISLVPFFGILSGALVHGESIEPTVILGLLISLAGLTIIQKY